MKIILMQIYNKETGRFTFSIKNSFTKKKTSEYIADKNPSWKNKDVKLNSKREFAFHLYTETLHQWFWMTNIMQFPLFFFYI